MKITNSIISTQSINAQNLGLKTGQIVMGTILKRLDNSTAIVRIGSQHFETRFSQGIPKSNYIMLRFDTIANSRFIFSLVEPSINLYDDVLFTTPKHPKAFLHKLLSLESFTVFTLHKAIFDSTSKGNYKFTSLVPILQRLLKKGISNELLQKFCYTLSKDQGISITMHILQHLSDSSYQLNELTNDEIQTIVSMMAKDDIVTLADYIFDTSKNMYTIPFYDEGNFSDAYILYDTNFVCIDVTFSYLGKLNIVIYNKDILYIKIYCFNDESFTVLYPHCQTLAQYIQENTGKKAVCTCIHKNEWEEKIIALINSMYIQHSVDFSA